MASTQEKRSTAEVTRSKDASPEYGKISKIELPNKSRIFISKKGWTLGTPDGQEMTLPYGEINMAITETIAQGYININPPKNPERTVKVAGKKWDVDIKTFRKFMKKAIPIHAKMITEPFEVETIEGIMHGKPGDFLIIGVRGETYPCDHDIFKETYEPC